MRSTFLASLAISLVFIQGCGPSQRNSLQMFAAISTKEALEEVVLNYEKLGGIQVSLSFGPSSELSRQIESGARADLFLSADEAWADSLAEKGLVLRRRDLLTNQLVVVIPATENRELKTLSELADPWVRRLALAGPAVPAGRYARQALEKAALWGNVEKSVLSGGDVRGALTYVARGEADAGIVYLTDAMGVSNVRVAFRVKPDSHAPIRYPLVLVRHDDTMPQADKFFDYLQSEKSSVVFKRLGFGWVPNTKNSVP